MASISQKLTAILKELDDNSDVSGCALVSVRGQIMASALKQDLDERSIAAMSAALMSVANRVGNTLDAGDVGSVTITGSKQQIIVYPLNKAVLIALAPANAKIGLIEYELDRTIESIQQVLG